jgi:GT2 family glycosyltransferase
MAGAPEGRAAAGPGPVTVAICNYNGEQHLPHCLDAVRALRGEIAEVLLADNASTDGSLALLRERYPEVRVLALSDNRGPTAARNALMRAARTRWVLALDNDAVCAPDLLLRLTAALADRPGIAIAQPRSLLDADPSRVHYDGGGFHYAGLVALRNFYVPLEEALGSGVVPVDCAIAVALLLDRERILALGGYDEGYSILFEDLDLSWRVRLAGLGIVSVEEALVRHRGGTEGVSFREGTSYPRQRVFLHSYQRWRFLLKSFRWRTLLVAAPGLLAYELFFAGFSLAGGNGGAWLQGKLRLLRELPEILALRREVQAGRRARDRELLVGGPLTTTPLVRRSALRRCLQGALDRSLRAWWWLVRPLAG